MYICSLWKSISKCTEVFALWFFAVFFWTVAAFLSPQLYAVPHQINFYKSLSLTTFWYLADSKASLLSPVSMALADCPSLRQQECAAPETALWHTVCPLFPQRGLTPKFEISHISSGFPSSVCNITQWEKMCWPCSLQQVNTGPWNTPQALQTHMFFKETDLNEILFK